MARLPDEVRAAIAADIRATRGTGAGSLRRIADRHGVAPGTVHTIAKEIDADMADRSATENATKACRASMAAQRAELAQMVLDRARRALEDMDSPHTAFNFGGKDNTYNEKDMDKPPTADQRNLAIICATLIDKHKILDTYDAAAAQGSAVDAWLQAMTGGTGK